MNSIVCTDNLPNLIISKNDLTYWTKTRIKLNSEKLENIFKITQNKINPNLDLDQMIMDFETDKILNLSLDLEFDLKKKTEFYNFIHNGRIVYIFFSILDKYFEIIVFPKNSDLLKQEIRNVFKIEKKEFSFFLKLIEYSLDKAENIFTFSNVKTK